MEFFQRNFSTKGLIFWTWIIAYTLHLVAIGCINFYRSTFDGEAWATTGLWQIWAALFFLMWAFGVRDKDNWIAMYRRHLDQAWAICEKVQKLNHDLIEKLKAFEAKEEPEKQHGV